MITTKKNISLFSRPIKILSKFFLITSLSLPLVGCLFDEPTALVSDPTGLDLDNSAPTCPGISSLTITAGPSLTVVWGQANDNFSDASKISYRIFMRKNAESYDLVSPAKIVTGATSTLISNGIGVGNTYTLFVQCADEKGNSFPNGPVNEQSIYVSDSLAPSQITDLAVVNTTFTSVLLTWSPSDDGEGGTTAGNMRYRVYGSQTSPVTTSGSPIFTLSSGQTSYLHTGLNPSSTWYYRVVALDLPGNLSTPSNEAMGVTLSDLIAPVFTANSSSITIDSASINSISLSWSAASDNVTAQDNLKYNVYRCAGSTSCNPFSGSPIVQLTSGVTSHTDTGLSASTIYVYGVRALDYSNNISINTDRRVTSTSYAATGTFYTYPTIEEVNLRMGTSLAIANVIGDATGPNAFPDLITGVPNASQPGTALQFTGCVFVFAGTATGVFASEVTYSFCAPNPIANGGQDNVNFGWGIATGDMDADGYQDIIVSNALRGRFNIYRTLISGNTLSIPSIPSTINHPTNNTGVEFGYDICVGDSDGVGADDLFIVAARENCDVACAGQTTTGNILVYNNISTPGNFIVPNFSYRISPTHSLQASGYSIQSGESVVRSCTVGKFDVDNPDEVQLVIGSGTVNIGAGAGNDGMVAFYRKTGTNTFTYQNVFPTVAPAVTGTQWGWSVRGIQLDTGIKELAVGARLDSTVGSVAGAAFVYKVTKSGSNFELGDPEAAFYGGSDYDNNEFGFSIAAGNIWGHTDGKEDFAGGARVDDKTTIIGAAQINFGELFTYRNFNGVLSAVIQQTNFSAKNVNVMYGHAYGYSMCKGDVNNDGFQDVIVGSIGARYDEDTMTTNNNVGVVYVYYGVEAGEIDFEFPSQIINAPGAAAGAQFGFSCVVMDYDGDGKQDLLVGSPFRSINVGSRGAVYIYNGAANSPLPKANTGVLTSPVNQANAYFGYSLAKGDLDNNGCQDLVIGSPGRSHSGVTRNGMVHVYWAGTCVAGVGAISMSGRTDLLPPAGAFGTGTNPHITNTPVTNTDMQFGRALETFRTVNGSAGLDLIVCSLTLDVSASHHYSGSPAANDIGNCYIYEGAVNGGVAKITDRPRNEIRYPSGYNTPTSSIWFGSSITKGDWNNDNREDLVICASRQQNLITFDGIAGACWAYFGRPDGFGGFSQYSGWRANNGGNRLSPEPDDVFYNPNAEPSTGSRFGESVLLLDINGNGSTDLLVGEPYTDNPNGPLNVGFDSGRVFVIRGGF